MICIKCGENIDGQICPACGHEHTQDDLLAADLFERGLKLLDKNDYPAAFDLLYQAADLGHSRAQTSVGTMYFQGLGVKKDCTEAIKWYRLAAEQGNAKAQNNLGYMYYRGIGVESDHAEAFRWTGLAARQGHAKAQYRLGYMYRYGEGVARDDVEAAKWFSLASDHGEAKAQYELGDMYELGQGVEQSYGEAFRWIRLSAGHGYAEAQHRLGRMYERGRGTEQDHTEAVKWYKHAAEQGITEAEYAIGRIYEQGLGWGPDVDEALAHYTAAAERGYSEAQFRLGYMYAYGEGVKRDNTRAFRWLSLAAKQGHDEAQFNLGLMYEQGIGVGQDHAEALKWFKLAAEQDNEKARLHLGSIYERGVGVEQDHAEALKWFKLAAAQGNATAQYNLGYMYDLGLGVRQDDAMALKYYRTAALQGDPQSQYALGLMYENGQGVAMDKEESHKWYRLAAGNGHEKAVEKAKKLSITNLTDIYEDNKNKPPEEILELIREHFVTCGERFRQGLMTEEEFYLATHYFVVYLDLWNRKNDIRVDRDQLNENPDFAASWREWKESGRVRLKPWMRNCIRHYGDLEMSVEWVFTVIDACKIPLCQFDYIKPENNEYPDIDRSQTYNTSTMILTRRCTDINKLLNEASPVGKSFTLNFTGGLVAEITVDEVQDGRYVCTGTITDYVEKPQRIVIDWDEGGSFEVTFNRKTFTPWQTMMQTYFDPVPHPKWRSYEAARLSRALRIEAEYKILRLPYMLGIEDNDSLNTAPPAERSGGKIIKLF